MRNLNLVAGFCLCLVGLAWGAAALAQDAPQDYPRIRAVTAFIAVDKDSYAARMDETSKFLAAAKTALN